MPRDQILVLDVGSSALKAVLFDRGGAVMAQATCAYPTASPLPGWFEQAPEDWAAAAREAVGGLGDLGRAALLTLTGTMQNLIPLDRDGVPLGRAMLYSDGRAAGRLTRFAARMRDIDAPARSGNQTEPLTTAARIDWLRAEAPDRFEATAMFHAGAKDYLAFRLTGRQVTDPTAASTTGMMNLAERGWDSGVLAALGIAADRLPRILPAEAALGPVTEAAAAWFGLPAGLAVLNGCGDAGAATVGAGTAGADEAHVYLGTTGWVARSVAAVFPRRPPDIYTLAHPLEGLLIEVAPILSAGDAVAWAEALFDDAPPGDEAGEPPLFLPYLKGERSPFHDAAVRGAFIGLDRAHGPASLKRAVREGVALAIRHNITALGEVRGALGVLGGGASNMDWMQAMADITGYPVAVHADPVGATALGAAILAGRTLGWDLAPPAPAIVLRPEPAAAGKSALLFRRYLAASGFLRADAAMRSQNVSTS